MSVVALPEGPQDMRSRLADGVRVVGLELSDAQIDQLLAYQLLIQKWNKVYNLTALRDPGEMLTHHLLDSLAVVPTLQRHLRSLAVVDVAGVGLSEGVDVEGVGLAEGATVGFGGSARGGNSVGADLSPDGGLGGGVGGGIGGVSARNAGGTGGVGSAGGTGGTGGVGGVGGESGDPGCAVDRAMGVSRDGVVRGLTHPVRLLDVGSGAGLPGVVFAICIPGLVVHCVDTVGKKAAFIQQVAASLRLPNLRGIHARVESLTDRYAVVSSRAFASLQDFTQWSFRALDASGVWMAMKGKHPEDELAALPADVEVFHVEPVSVPGLDADRCIVWMCKSSKS